MVELHHCRCEVHDPGRVEASISLPDSTGIGSIAKANAEGTGQLMGAQAFFITIFYRYIDEL